ncbi:ribose-5-phosphate isomerase [Okibacterium endophyticum]
MRIHIAADHNGYERARALESTLSAVHEVIWHGPAELDPGDDYPVFAIRVGQAVVADEDAGTPARGVIVGASGAGESIAANKVAGVRAIAGATEELVREARRHADVSIVTIGTRILDRDAELAVVQALIDEPFAGLLDDARRILNTNEFESAGTIEGWLIDEGRPNVPTGTDGSTHS